MPPTLPGYYFDTEKNRYFKIQANHIAPSGSNYSRQAVKAEKVIKTTQKREESTKRAKTATTVRKSTLLQHPLLSFQRQLGDLRKSLRTTVAEYYAASLEGRDAFTGSAARGFEVLRYPSIVSESGCFAIDHSSGTLFGDFTWRNFPNAHLRRGADLFALHRNENPFSNEDEFAGTYPTWRTTSQQDKSPALYNLQHYETITRVTRVEAIASIGSGLVVCIQGSRSDQTPQETRVKVGACHTGPFSSRNDMVHESAFYSYVQDLAVQPGVTPSGQPSYMVALATGSSLWLMDTSSWQYPVAQYPLNQHDGTKDMMKIQFKDHNILMAGTRSGKMLLLDVREPPSAQSNASATRIQHSSAITNLRALPRGNGTSILIAGVGSDSAKIYDLRWTPSPRLKCHFPRANSYRLSPSILTFAIPETRRTSQYRLGWAYDEELNLMVHASTDHVRNHRVGLWDCGTGRMVSSPLNDFVFDHPIRCGDVARVRDGPKSIILGSAGGSIVEWTGQGVGTGTRKDDAAG